MNIEFIKLLNKYGSLKEPFFFMISYDLKKFVVEPLSNLPLDIEFEFCENFTPSKQKFLLEKFPISFEEYKQKFLQVQEEIKSGNSYLLNLTAPTKIKTNLSLQEIYNKSKAKFKLKYKDEFVCFSPERFVKISNDKIYTFPMKGTIDASIANAKQKILDDEKEMAEHIMVVDLLRNDLSQVASKVRVDKFRYIEKVATNNNTLLQVSSQISGELNSNWNENIGNILSKLLPAGSITGTPKKKTVEILKRIENYDREYYTGVFGVFDGKNFDSSVMIRFIQKDKNEKLIYKSGGGITSDSCVKSEYKELINKIYLPF